MANEVAITAVKNNITLGDGGGRHYTALELDYGQIIIS
jgi:hypothetical protein